MSTSSDQNERLEDEIGNHGGFPDVPDKTITESGAHLLGLLENKVDDTTFRLAQAILVNGATLREACEDIGVSPLEAREKLRDAMLFLMGARNQNDLVAKAQRLHLLTTNSV